MAIVFSNLGASANPDINDGTDASSYVNTSWTPPTSGLIYAFVSNRVGAGTADLPTVSGNGITWTQIATNVSTSKRITLFGANASGSTAGITAVDFGGVTQTNCEASFAAATGVNLTGGVAAAFVQSVSGSGTGTSGAITLAAAGNANNRPISGWMQTTNEAKTPQTNWTGVDDLRHTTPVTDLETQWRSDAFDTAAAATWVTSVAWVGIAAEVKASTSAAVSQPINVAVGMNPSIAKRIFKKIAAATTVTAAITAVKRFSAHFQTISATTTLTAAVSAVKQAALPGTPYDAAGVTYEASMTYRGTPVVSAVPNLLPDLQVIITFGVNKRILNGIGANSVCDTIRWSSIIPGGHNTFSCRMADAERTAHPTTYKYGATITLRAAPAVGGVAESGPIYWQGYLRTPVSNDDGTCNLLGNGWHRLLAEREDALLWQDRYYGDWQTADAQGFALGREESGITNTVNNSSLVFKVPKGTVLNDGQKARLVWYYADALNTQVLPRNVAATIYKNQSLASTPDYALKLERYDGPALSGSAITVNTYTNALGNTNIDDNGTGVNDAVAQTVPHPVISIGLYRNGDTGVGGAGFTFKVTIKDLRVNDLAPGDAYVSSQVVGDIANSAHMNFTVGSGVATTTTNILPLFWASGTWFDLIDYLATAEGYQWGVEEMNPTPEFFFRPWGHASTTTWTANGYGSTATTIAQLAPDDEVYNVIDVAYTQGQSSRIRHVRQLITPDPFAGLSPPRFRTFKYALQDAQEDQTLATTIAATLAAEYGTEQLAGTVTGSYFKSGTDQTSYAVRAGDRLTIPDYPGGSQTVRIYGVDHSDNAPSVLTIGRVPSRLDRLLFWADQKKRHRGTIAG